MKLFKKIINTTNPILPIAIAFLFVFAIVFRLSYKYYLYDADNFVENLLVEAHGTVMDIIIFGMLFTFINNMRNKKIEIQRFKEEIDDFRHWNDPGASYRIAGILRRLNKHKIHQLDLSHCNLSGAQLKNIHLQKTIFEKANLSEANLAYADLSGTNLRVANLTRADLRIANLQGADLRMADLQHAKLRITNFKGANLFNANLKYADLKTANLENCDLTTVNMEDADLKSASLEESDMTNARLQKADLRSAKLKGTNLRRANLKGALLGDYISLLKEDETQEEENFKANYSQLMEVASLEDAIMPDGSKYDKRWEAIIKNDFEKMTLQSKNN